ncbi:MAG: flippase-like domain-containing protein [Flavobacteriales bacterium]|nr:flippase-like domain-containing protein [Flavobacteriales bacterium]
MKAQIIKILKIVIPLGIGVYLSWYFYSNLSEEEKSGIPKAFANANYFWVVLSLAIAWLSHFSRAYRWKFMLEPLGFKPKISSLYHSVMIGYIINLTVPRSGELARAGFLSKKENLPVETVFGTIVAERVIDVIMLGIVTLTTYFVVGQAKINQITSQGQQGEESFPWLYVIAGSVMVLGVLALIISKKLRSIFISKLKGMWVGVKTIFTLKKKIQYIAHTLFIWIAYVVMFWVCAQGISGVDGMTMETMLACFVVGAVAIAITPGGIGVYPVFVTSALVKIGGFGESDASGFAILMWVIQTGFLVVFGLYSLYAIKLKFSETKSLEPSQETV